MRHFVRITIVSALIIIGAIDAMAIEEAKYELIIKDNKFEISDYSSHILAETAVAIFQGDWALSQLWLFWLAPIAGALLAGVVYRWFEVEKNA